MVNKLFLKRSSPGGEEKRLWFFMPMYAAMKKVVTWRVTGMWKIF